MIINEWLDTDLQKNIWENKYRYNQETLEEWFNRISNGNKNIRKLIKEKKFLFGGRILASRGLDKYGKKISLSNCYVITPPDDNLESIFDTAKKLARTYSYNGGCGIDISNLRPNGFKVNNAAKETTGATSFMDLYDLITKLIGQNGRRGALMISIIDSHPDIEQFINIKKDLSKITKANISIRITNKFMDAVKLDKEFELYFKCNETNEEFSKKIKAKELFRKLCENNWDYAEPGLLFWDRINEWNLLSEDDNFAYAGVNPCAEETLPAGGSCLLGSINLSEFVINKQFDFKQFNYTVEQSIIALNEVLDEGLPLHPLQEQRDSVKNWRQIGLGIMGLADMLIKLRLKYGNEQSIKICEKIAYNLSNTAIKTSCLLAKEKGKFPMYSDKILESKYLKKCTTNETFKLVEKHGLRNSQLLTCAPTGTLSSLLDISGGIEPLYALYYTRKTESLHKEDKYYKVFPKIVKNYIDSNKIKFDNLPNYFVTSHNIYYTDRIKMQSVWQRYIDASISSTINLKKETSIDDIENLYIQAWEYGLKGVTIFRDNCKRLGILTIDNKNTKVYNSTNELPRGYVIKSSDDLIGKKGTINTGCGTLHAKTFFDEMDGNMLEVFLSKGSQGGCQAYMIGFSRLLSLALRSGTHFSEILDQLNSVPPCPSYLVRSKTKCDTSNGVNCPNAIGIKLQEMYKQMLYDLGLDDLYIEDIETKKTCPDCKNDLIFEGGCNSCKNCGYSKCE